MELFSRCKMSEQERAALETRLNRSLYRVQPRVEYVRDLKGRLVKTTIPAPVARSEQLKRYAPWIAAGVLGGIVLLVTGIRAVLGLLGPLGMQRQRNGASLTSPSPLSETVKVH
jgi:ElaB/YqjD/DUF883 family membrane-anchored ribosome-binding protein